MKELIRMSNGQSGSTDALLAATCVMFNLARRHHQGYIEKILEEQSAHSLASTKRMQRVVSFMFNAIGISFVMLVIWSVLFLKFPHMSFLTKGFFYILCAYGTICVLLIWLWERRCAERDRIEAVSINWKMIESFKRVWMLMQSVYPGVASSWYVKDIVATNLSCRIQDEIRTTAARIKAGKGQEPVHGLSQNVDVYRYYKDLINLAVRLHLLDSESFAVFADGANEEEVYTERAKRLYQKMINEAEIIHDGMALG